MLELADKSKIIFFKLLVVKEIFSCLPPGLEERQVCREEHIS